MISARIALLLNQTKKYFCLQLINSKLVPERLVRQKQNLTKSIDNKTTHFQDSTTTNKARVFVSKATAHKSSSLKVFCIRSYSKLYTKLTLPFICHSLVFTTIVSSARNNMASCKDVPSVVFEEADKLFDADKLDELLELLKSQKNWEDNEQVLWRVARAEFTIAKKIKDAQPDEYKKKVAQAYGYVKKSLSLNNEDGRAHKWAAILLNEHSGLQGTKERVLQVLNVRQHMEDAIKYNPTDATSHYLLGEWHYGCNQVSWWERKLASVAFGKLPDADMEKALESFEKAEQIEQDFYSKNKLMLAKTLLDFKRDKDRAVALLKDVVSMYSASEKWDDKEAVEEASKILKTL